MNRQHYYELSTEWTGNTGAGTINYQGYQRNYLIRSGNKPAISGSSDPAFRGDRNKYNPEELLLASLSSCHMLWFLHLCTEAGVVVTSYTDEARGTMSETKDGGGRFTEVVLSPRVTVQSADMIETALTLHPRAKKLCFIANSVNFPVLHKPETIVEE